MKIPVDFLAVLLIGNFHSQPQLGSDPMSGQGE